MKNVLFVSPTYYELPLNDNLKKKYKFLSDVANIFVFAFSDKKSFFKNNKTHFYLFKKNNIRILNYIKILYLTNFQIFRIIKDNKIDIVTFQDPITSFVGIRKLKKNHKDIKIVLESHGDFINTMRLEKNLMFPGVYEYLFKKIAKYTASNADILRAVSSSTENQILSFAKDKQVVRFPAWIDFEEYKNIIPKRNENKNFQILFIGSVTDRKKPHMIVDALPDLLNKDVELHIVGPTPNENYLSFLQAKIIDNKLKKRVFIHGVKNRDEVKEFYSKINLMILPSVSEGLARVIFESQVASCPVLVTDAPGMQDIVIDGQTGYIFKSNNQEALTEKINYILSNYEEAEMVGINAKEFILSNFSSDNFKFSFKKIFDTVS